MARILFSILPTAIMILIWSSNSDNAHSSCKMQGEFLYAIIIKIHVIMRLIKAKMCAYDSSQFAVA